MNENESPSNFDLLTELFFTKPFHFQNSLSNASGMLLRGYKREATAILQKDPDILRSLVQVPASSIANIIARAKDNVVRQLAALATIQTSPESLKYSSSETYFENNQGFRQAELLVQPIKAAEYSSNVTSFLSRNVNSPYLQQHRGFKTLRSRSESTPFRSEKEDDLTSTEELIKRILKKGNPTKEEMEQITNMLKDVQLSQDEKKQVITWVFFVRSLTKIS